MYKNIEQNNDPKYYGRYADDNNKFIDKDTNQNITIKQCAEWVDKDGISDFFYCSNCNYKAHYTEIKKVQCPRCKAIIIGTRSDVI